MRLSLGFKVFIGFFIINLLYIIILIVAVIRLSNIGQKASIFSNTYLPLYKYAQRVESYRYLNSDELRNTLENKETNEKIATLESYHLSFKNNSSEYIVRLKSLLAMSEKVFSGSDEEKFYIQLLERVKSLEQRTEQYTRSIEKLIDSIKLGIYPGPIDYWIPVENAENVLKKEQKIFIMQVEGLMRLLIRKIENEENTIRWQLIFFTFLAFITSILVVWGIEKRLRKIVRFSSKLDSMILHHKFEPIMTVEEDEISELINNINKLTAEFLNIQKETEENRNQLLILTANLRKLNLDLDYLKSFNESIINSIKISILVLNEKYEIIKYNPAAKMLLGLSEEANNLNLFNICPGLENDNIKDAVKIAIYEKKTQTIEEIQIKINNDQFIFDIIISPFLGENNAIKGVIMIIEDRTEIIKTKRLLNQSERLATIGKMAAQLTHQIKNPLSTIGLNLEFIREDLAGNKLDTTQYLQKIDLIQSEIDNLIKLSDEYLRFAKISNTQIEDIDINQLIKQIEELYGPECNSKNIKVNLNLCNEKLTIKGDTNQFKQAIVNIFVNAIESLNKDGIITITTGTNEGCARIDISDNGKGIDESIIKEIFNPFYSTKDGGFGLGLSIAAQIIEESGGMITCKNNPSGGVTFTIKIPL